MNFRMLKKLIKSLSDFCLWIYFFWRNRNLRKLLVAIKKVKNNISYATLELSLTEKINNMHGV